MPPSGAHCVTDVKRRFQYKHGVSNSDDMIFYMKELLYEPSKGLVVLVTSVTVVYI